MKKFLSIMTVLAMVLVMIPSTNAAGATVTLTPSTVTTTGITTANDVVVAYTTAGVFSNGDTIKITVKNAAGTLLSTADVVGGAAATLAAANSGADTQATDAADGSFAYGAGTATYTISSAGAATAVSLTFALPRLEGGVYTINVAENRAFSSAPETYGAAQLNANANVVGATLAFVQSTPATITDSGSNFVNNGFKAGQSITVSGATTGGNDGTYIIQAVSAGTLTLQAGATLAQAEAGAVGTIVAAATQANQVRVSAVVEPILGMALSANAIDLGVLDPASVKTSTNTVTVLTNAGTGYVLQAANAQVAGLTTGTYNIVADDADSILAGTSGFSIEVTGLTAKTTNGTNSTVAAPAGVGDGSVALSNVAATIATGNGTTDGSVATVTYKAAVSAVQEAGNYATTVTYTVTGNF